jgi:hypothetical protein
MSFTLVLFYIGLLGFGAMISPGIGFSGQMIVMVPPVVAEFSHAPAYGLLTWLLTSGLRGRGWPRGYACLVAAAGAMVFGIWMEVFQGFVPGRVVDIGDVMVNGVGIGMAVLLILWRALPVGGADEISPARPSIPALFEQGAR